jgi:membrane protease YdiL (CAAX protease family)
MRLTPALARPQLTVPVAREPGLAGPTIALAVALVVFGNSIAALPGDLQDHGLTIAAKLGVMCALVAVLAVALRVPARDLGLQRDHAGRGLLTGASLAVLLSLPIVAFFAFPVVMPGGEIEYAVVEEKSARAFWTWMLVTLPLSTALFEEVVFRGCLHGLAVRAYGLVAGIALTSMTFVLWHGVINYKTMQATNAADTMALTAGAHVASFAGLFAGGVIFSVLRHRTGSVAAPFAFHWLIVLAMNTTLYLLS